jgi:phosphatidylglycerol:prolipoprotein diacylglycerol transferase
MHPTLFRLGPIGIHTFGLMMACGFMAALLVIQREYRRKGIDPELAASVIFMAIVGGVAGAKLYYVGLTGWDLRSILSGAGLAWYGGLMGGVAAVLIMLMRDKRALRLDDAGNPTGRRLGEAIDPVGPATLIGQMCGRIGCFLSGDGDYGPPTDLPWAIAFPNGTIPTVIDGEAIAVHPTMLYDVLMLGAAFAVVWVLRKTWDHRPGTLFGLSLILLALARFASEFWRMTKVFAFTSTPMGWETRSLRDHVDGTAWSGTLMAHGISEFQIWSLVAIAGGVVVIWRARSASRQNA